MKGIVVCGSFEVRFEVGLDRRMCDKNNFGVMVQKSSTKSNIIVPFLNPGNRTEQCMSLFFTAMGAQQYVSRSSVQESRPAGQATWPGIHPQR